MQAIIHILIIGFHYIVSTILSTIWLGYIVLYAFLSMLLCQVISYVMDHYIPLHVLNKLSITKIKHPSEKLTEKDMLLSVASNLIVLFGLGYIYLTDAFSIGYEVRGAGREITLGKTLLELLGYYIIYDILFYYGHRLLHLPTFYHLHKKHHTTFGTVGMSAYYMSLPDFLLEAVIPFITGPILLNGNVLSLLCWSLIGSMNTTLVHSGYMMPYFVDGDHHFLHHKKNNVNYGIMLLDGVHKTKYRE